MPIIAILFTRQGGNPTKHKKVFSRDAKGSVARIQGDSFASDPNGIMEVAVWLCIPLLLRL